MSVRDDKKYRIISWFKDIEHDIKKSDTIVEIISSLKLSLTTKLSQTLNQSKCSSKLDIKELIKDNNEHALYHELTDDLRDDLYELQKIITNIREHIGYNMFHSDRPDSKMKANMFVGEMIKRLEK